MQFLSMLRKPDVPDDIVNATMTELSFMLLFTVGLLTYLIGGVYSNAMAGGKPSCLFEYNSDGHRLKEERAVIKVTILPDKIIRIRNIKDHRHISGTRKLVGSDDFNWLNKQESYSYSQAHKLIEDIERINIKTSAQDNAINRSCRFYALYEIHMHLPNGQVRQEDLDKYIRTKDILYKLSVAALAANSEIVKRVLLTIDAQTPIHTVEGHLLLLNGTKGGPYLVINR